MAARLQSVFLLVAVLAVQVLGQCVSYGIDYANGGEYNIDSTLNEYFSFTTIFQGCTEEEIFPVLVDPANNRYSCSGIPTDLEGQEVTSTCGIPFSAMRTGEWRILIAGEEVQVQRTLSLIVGEPEETTVTATPTVVLGITSTPEAVTVESTQEYTATLILVSSTVTAPCGDGETQTITDFRNVPTVVVETTVTRTSTDGQVTSYYETTESTQADCHYPTPGKREIEEREVAAVAATTVTVTQTTYTVTQTDVTTLPPATTTELVFETVTTTVSPPPTTVCQGGGEAVVITVNPNQEPVTQTNLVYETSHLSGTVWVGQTEYVTVTDEASATACWRAGGWYGL